MPHAKYNNIQFGKFRYQPKKKNIETFLMSVLESYFKLCKGLISSKYTSKVKLVIEESQLLTYNRHARISVSSSFCKGRAPLEAGQVMERKI
jgi:hypothetical protein